jgi:hypothetical protein
MMLLWWLRGAKVLFACSKMLKILADWLYLLSRPVRAAFTVLLVGQTVGLMVSF